jgi:hypothetical protein
MIWFNSVDILRTFEWYAAAKFIEYRHMKPIEHYIDYHYFGMDEIPYHLERRKAY